MITQLRSVRLQAVGRVPGAVDKQTAMADVLGRLLQVALVLYLIPVLVLVLVVGGVGMLLLAIARLFTGPVPGPAGRPRTPVGPASLSS